MSPPHSSPLSLIFIGQLKFLQSNLSHSTAANGNANQYMIDKDIDIFLLQHAHSNREGTLSIFSKNCKIFPSKHNSAYVAVRDTNFVIIHHQITGVNSVFISVTAKESEIFIGSTMPLPPLTLKTPLRN